MYGSWEAAHPPVVFDPGLGDTADEWAHIQRAVAAFMSAVAYDRAGLGRSMPPSERELPRTSGRMADELYSLLYGAGVPSPYVLVGHSLGGLNVQLFAARYPKEVAGMVLVDAAFAEMPEWVDGLLSGEE